MKYLPILQELFESDTVILLAIGLACALILGFGLKNNKKLAVGAGISAAVYGCCEAASNLRGSYLQQLALLFLGTAALGCLAGFGLLLLAAAGKR